MITQGTVVTDVCEECGGELRCDVGQFIERGGLWWGTEGWCESCPRGWCDRDTGPVTPDRIRQPLLRAHGPARLRLTDGGARPARVMAALREAADLTLPEARARAAALADGELTGTLVEMEFLALHLRRRAIAATVEPAG
ncbi:hypothetical protein [Streptomyces wuyuanensis]|uniref:hypothetical protein n=1 Tax=Streptomyces wuyuanensis TaxID=1196353 RepID=UPI003434865F